MVKILIRNKAEDEDGINHVRQCEWKVQLQNRSRVDEFYYYVRNGYQVNIGLERDVGAVGQGSWHGSQGVLKLRRPFLVLNKQLWTCKLTHYFLSDDGTLWDLHEFINGWHRLSIVDTWRRLRPVQVADARYPPFVLLSSKRWWWWSRSIKMF